MSYYFFHPLGEKYSEAPPFSYYGSFNGGGPHGNGKLDMSIGEVPFYAMVTGKIVFCGTWNDGTVAIVQECTDSGLGTTFYIRYLHGKNDTSLLNKVVQKGTQLGLVSNNNGAYGNHLHVDFSLVPNGFQPVIGTLNESERTWVFNGHTFKLRDDCNLSQVAFWASQNDGAYNSYNYRSGTFKNPGYCWLVFASPCEYKNPTDNYGESASGNKLNLTESIYQNDSTLNLPTGCEVTSLGIALHYKKYNNQPSLTKLIQHLVLNTYLPQGNLPTTTGPDPEYHFVGTPQSSSSYGCFSTCIVNTIKNYNSKDKQNVSYTKTTGQELSKILGAIDAGNPILAWVTFNNLHEIVYKNSWTISDTSSDRNGQKFTWPGYEHCLVIIGYDDTYIYTADPMSSSGFATYDRKTFEKRYEEMGKHSIVIK